MALVTARAISLLMRPREQSSSSDFLSGTGGNFLGSSGDFVGSSGGSFLGSSLTNLALFVGGSHSSGDGFLSCSFDAALALELITTESNGAEWIPKVKRVQIGELDDL